MPKRPETTQEWLNRYEKKRIKAFDNYQSTGEPRYDRQEEEYRVICDALRALLQKENDRDDTIRQRMMNKDSTIDRMTYKEEYTRDEVIKMLNNAVWW